MYRTMQDLANTLAAFHADVIAGGVTYNVTLVAISEFGRNVRENGSRGTDHGRGSVMFVMGPQVAGGRVLTNNWVPLAARTSSSGRTCVSPSTIAMCWPRSCRAGSGIRTSPRCSPTSCRRCAG